MQNCRSFLSQHLDTWEGAAFGSAQALGQLRALTALVLFGHSADEEGRSAAFLEILGAHPSLQLVEVTLESSRLPRMPQLKETLRRRGWVCMPSTVISNVLVYRAPGLCVQL